MARLLFRLALPAVLLANGGSAASSPVAASQSVTRLWSAAPTARILTEEKSFDNEGATLSGTLHYPESGRGLSAMVVVHGASSPSRDLALYRHLTRMLPPLGMAVFVYDRRGSGKSGGNLAASDYAMLADDAIAAMRMLRSDPRIDPAKIGFWGLSQGGWLSLLAASRADDAAFAVSVSAPMVRPDEQMVFASANIMRIHGFSETEVAEAVIMRRAVDGFLKGEVSRSEAERRLHAARDKPWFKLIYMSRELGDPKTSRWLREMRHDPLQNIASLKVPALVLYGAADPWVPVTLSMERLTSVTGPVTRAVVAGADHSMMLSASPLQQISPEYFDMKAPDAPEYFGRLTEWLAAQALLKSSSDQGTSLAADRSIGATR